MAYRDKQREATTRRRWYEQNRDRAAENRKNWRARNPGYSKRYYDPTDTRRRAARGRRLMAEYKLERGCADCGYRGHPAALQFDHIAGDKLTEVSKLKTFSWDAILREIAKCEVVCANCHVVRTVERGQHRSSQTESVDGLAGPTLFDLLE